MDAVFTEYTLGHMNHNGQLIVLVAAVASFRLSLREGTWTRQLRAAFGYSPRYDSCAVLERADWY
jgi:hypothetical protein